MFASCSCKDITRATRSTSSHGSKLGELVINTKIQKWTMIGPIRLDVVPGCKLQEICMSPGNAPINRYVLHYAKENKWEKAICVADYVYTD